jgi:hypothetical protein
MPVLTQTADTSFSMRRNTPLYHLKTHPDRVEMCLWLLAEGMDISVLVRFTGPIDATLSRWLARAGLHSETCPPCCAFNWIWRTCSLMNCMRRWRAISARVGCGWRLSQWPRSSRQFTWEDGRKRMPISSSMTSSCAWLRTASLVLATNLIRFQSGRAMTR